MKIPILHLEDGLHRFDFLVKSKSLDFDCQEVYPEELKIGVDVNKFEKNIICDVDIRTNSHYACDRCLDNYVRPYRENFRLLFHFGAGDFETDEEDVVILQPDTLEIDISENVIEYLILTIPMKNLCKPDCKGICPSCGAELNHEACGCAQTAIDPRWEGLRKLLK